MPQVEDDHIVKHATAARAGVAGHNVRYVLVFQHVRSDRALCRSLSAGRRLMLM